MLALEDLKNPGRTIEGQEWYFVTDGVMGGVSEGSAKLDNVEKTTCHRMTGNVSTENNGGFIQIRTLLKPKININDYEGIFAYIYGNNKNYRFHIRTGSTVAPWQYYSYNFLSPNKWIEIRAPFSKFKKSNFYQPKSLLNQKMKSVGLVAGFEDFKADICLAKIGLY
tara:strand:- start:238 stop:738 length:501 start_codon:yes stop_codon:yes gene_type:complete